MTEPQALTDERRAAWHPVCAGSDLPPRHVFHGQLWGQELAIWRADDGFVNVWDNRCLHRGVRLTLGVNDGTQLRCAYHGWRYANRTAGCVYIPAHPADAPARTICNRVYRAVERYGLVWTALAPAGEPPVLSGIADDALALRGIAVNAGAAETEAALADFDPGLRLFVQPVDAGRCVIRGVFVDRPGDEIAALRAVNARLSALRDRLEAAAARAAPPAPIPWEHHPAGEPSDLAAATGRRPACRVRIAARHAAAEDVIALRLEPLAGPLPPFQPGAHIDVHLPNGLVRQYSLTNGPELTTAYEIAVKLEDGGGGGSRALHRDLREGDVLAISAPHNNFPLRRDSLDTTLIAGGIGVTPLVAMAKALRRMGLPYAFHVFARSAAHVPLAETLGALEARTHVGLDAAATGAALAELLAAPRPRAHVYICGPRPMMDAARRIAAEAGWADEQIHFEYFANDTEIDMSSAFEVELARSALTVQVAAGRTILEAVRAAGVDVPTSCEQGACGTCRCAVIEGTPDHKDVCLTETEKARGDQMMICVSRALTPRLVLDL